MTSSYNLSNLIIPWSIDQTPEEISYQQQGFVRTIGTHFIKPPPEDDLIHAFNKAHLGTELSVGARALCKHHARIDPHPYWTKPTGSPQNKSKIAKSMLYRVLDNATWKNIHRMPNKTLVLEIRTDQGYGMRWSLEKELMFVGYLEDKIEKQ